MNKKCARCDKTVYPIEELKCLDKIWHKLCFKCQECGMALNMRTYKGFNKQPYCEAHIPKAKATTMAETPEFRRIAENTKIQSNVKYHEDFEKAKGKVTQIADDPEILRIRANTKIISNVAYHGDLEKKAIMEMKREKEENGDAHENQVHHPVQLPQMPPPTASNNHHPAPTNNHHHQPAPSKSQPPPPQQHHQMPASYQPGRIADYDPILNQEANRQYVSPYSVRQSAQTVIYTSERGAVNSQPTRKIGSIADLDPVNDYYGSLTPEYPPANYAGSRTQPQQQHHQPPPQQHYHHQGPPPQQQPQHHHQSAVQQLEQQRLHQMAQQQQVQQQQRYQQQLQHQQQLQLQQQQLQQQQQIQQQLQQQQQQQQLQQQLRMQQQQQPQKPAGRMYRAMYDYDAQDADEVSFMDGDILIGCTSIDEGWMTGTVQRTGVQGMLPANYVELVN